MYLLMGQGPVSGAGAGAGKALWASVSLRSGLYGGRCSWQWYEYCSLARSEGVPDAKHVWLGFGVGTYLDSEVPAQEE